MAALPVTHIVMFKFKKTADTKAVSDLCNSTLSLKDRCIHPTSNAPYIKSIKGGTDNSPEGIQGGLTHAFVMEFENAEDRDYYVNKDPVHAEFKKAAGELVEKAQVIDFMDGVFVDPSADAELEKGEVRYGMGGY